MIDILSEMDEIICQHRGCLLRNAQFSDEDDDFQNEKSSKCRLL